MKKKRKRDKDGHDITALRAILPSVGESLGLERKAQEMAVMALWRQQVPPRYRETTRPLRLKNQGGQWILQVLVQDGATASELSFELSETIARMNTFAGETGLVIARAELGVGSISPYN